jgi:hypothetical protein
VFPQENSSHPLRWKAVHGPLTRIVVAVVLVYGAVAVAEVTVKSLRGVLSLDGALPATYYLAYLIVSMLSSLTSSTEPMFASLRSES